MYYTGYADEAGVSIDVQIKAIKELGWSNIETRNIDNANIIDLTDSKFEEVCEKLGKADIKVNCFGSTVANWSKDPYKEEDFTKSIEELKRAFPRMKRLGTLMIRGMSFKMQFEELTNDNDLAKIIFKKLAHFAKMCEDNGVLYLHENCNNYGGQSYKHTLIMLENVKSSAFKLIFDTGNPVATDNRIGKPPFKKQSAWEFYKNVREYVHHVHIKDGKYIKTEEGKIDVEWTYPGEGAAEIPKIIKDLIKNKYDGGFSMEPHMAVVFHDPSIKSSDQARYDNFIEYGKRFMKLVNGIKK